MASPCIDVCRYDHATGWCLGCGLGRRERRRWKRDATARAAILRALDARLATLAAAGLPTGKAARGWRRAGD